MSSVVSELVLKFTGDASNAIAAISALDGKMASAVKNYASNLGVMDSSLSRSATTQAEAFSKGQLAAAKAAVAQGTAAQAANDLTKAQAALGKSVAASADIQALAATKVEAAQGRVVLAQDAANKATKASADAAGASTTKFASMNSAIGLVGAGVLLAGGLLAKGAADFQQSTAVLATSGGETASELEAARQGILRLSGSTGTVTSELTKGLYMLGSAGFDVAHGGLQALQAGAQGAKAENADLGTVTNALSTVLTDYGIKITNNAAGQKTANAVMDQMIAITSNGKTTTEALAGSLHSVLPVAAAAGLSFAQVGGALATMTGEGMSADQASQNLANAIRSLQNPSSAASKEMQAMGLNSNDVASQLGKKGLTGTISDLTTAITAHMGPAGMVIQDTFRASKIAAQDADAMIAKMPPNLQTLAKAYMDGSVTAKDWRKDLLALDPVSRNLMTQFGATANKTHEFNDLLASGSPDAQTYTAALSKMMGGATGLSVALKLSGDHAGTFNSDVGKVADAAQHAGSSVDGWKLIQENFNQKLAEAKLSVQAVGISIGTALLPAFSSLMGIVLAIVSPIASFVNSNQGLIKILAPVTLGLAGLAVAIWAVNVALDANPIVLIVMGIIAGVAAIITAIYFLVKNWSTIWGEMTSVWNDFYSAVIAPIIHAWDSVNWGAAWDAIRNAVASAWNALIGVWNAFYSAAIEPIIHAWDAINWGAVWDSILAATETVWSAITSGWSSFVGGLVTVWATVSTPFVAAWNTVWAALKKPLADLVSAFSGLGSSFTSIWSSGISPAINTLKKSWDSVWDSMKGAISGLGDAFSGVGSTLTSIWSSGVYPAITSIKKAWDSIWGSLKDAVSNVGKSFSGIGSTITGIWSQSLRPALDSIGKAFSGLGKTASDLWNKDIKPAFEEIGKAISSLWSSGSPAKKSTEGATTGVHALGTESHNSGITIKTAFDAILDVVKFVLQSIAVAITIVADVIKVFAVVIGWLANEIFAPMFRIIASVVSVAVQAIVVGINIVSVAIKVVATVVAWLAQNIFVPMFKLIADAVSVAATLISVAIDIVTTVIRAVAVVISWLAQNIVVPMVKIITDAFQVAATIISGIADVIGAIIRGMAAVFSTVLAAIQNNILQVWGAISVATTTTWNAIVTLVEGIWNTLKNDAITLFTAIQNAIQVVWNTISTAASVMWNAISTAIQVIWNALKLAATTIFTAIQNAIQAVWNTISTAAGTMWNSISNNVIQPIWNALKATAGTVFTGIQNTIQGVWDSINTAAKTMWDAIVTTISTAWNGVKKAVADPINVVITIGNAFINGANKVLGIVGVPAIPDIPGPVKFATGGTVPGGWGGGDTVPAMLTPGERVLSTHQVKQMGGHNNIDNMLGMAHGGAVPVQYFADGGVVKSGGMSNGVFHGSWKDNVDGVTYQDTDPSGGHFKSAADLTALVNGSSSVKNTGGSIVGGLVSAAATAGNAALGAAKTVASVPGLVTSALVGLGKDFVFGALAAAANLALAPLKAAVGALPDKPLGAGLAKGGAHKILDGVYNFIAHKDKELGHAPVAVGGSGTTGSVSVAQEAAALAYAVAHFMGLPYTWGNNDCSGIVQKSYAAQGVSLPRVSSTQYGASVAVSEASAVPGDLAFYNPGASGAPAGLPGHVGFYAGSGKIFDAYNTSRPIGYDSLSLPGNTFMGIRRPGGVAGSSTAPGGNVGAWINAALAAESWPTSWASSINTIIQRESGGNPNIVNTTDSNAKAGTPSTGLMQVIWPTFEAYRDPKLANSMTDPVANIVAAVKYILSRYGSVAAVASRPGGYEVGAWDTGYRAHMAMIHPNEMIIPAGPASAIRSGYNLFGDGEPVSSRGHGSGSGIDYDKLAAAMANHQNGVTIQNMNVGSTAQAEDVIHELSWHLRTVKMV